MLRQLGYNYEFDENACASCGGKCCIGEQGYIWLNGQEITELAKYLGLDNDIFKEKYTKTINSRVTLLEKPHNEGWACIFYDNGCTVYFARPKQCASFPFWKHFLDEPQSLCCPGVHFGSADAP